MTVIFWLMELSEEPRILKTTSSSFAWKNTGNAIPQIFIEKKIESEFH